MKITFFTFRSFVRLKLFVHNRAYPEGSIAEGYIVDECLTFCSRFLEGTTRFTKPARNPDLQITQRTCICLIVLANQLGMTSY
jgi:hypothetical protein